MGSRLLYYLVLYPLGKAPYFIIYGFSNLLFLTIFYVVRYRRKVVRDNLEKCFPEKDSTWIRDVEKKFYKHLADLFMESVKNFGISEEQAQLRMKSVDAEVVHKLGAQGRSVVIAGGHYNNWELWAVAAAGQMDHKVIGVYKKLSNEFFNEKMKETRGRFGMLLVPTIESGAFVRSNPDLLKAMVLAFDQSPSNPQKCIWVDFMGRKTASYFGAEKYGIEFDMPIVYGHLKKLKRGYYEVRYELVCEFPRETAHGEITRKLYGILETEIMEAPQYWLWSHRRWKHKPPADF